MLILIFFNFLLEVPLDSCSEFVCVFVLSLFSERKIRHKYQTLKSGRPENRDVRSVALPGHPL